jgi:hypothetical protein
VLTKADTAKPTKAPTSIGNASNGLSRRPLRDGDSRQSLSKLRIGSGRSERTRILW